MAQENAIPDPYTGGYSIPRSGIIHAIGPVCLIDNALVRNIIRQYENITNNYTHFLVIYYLVGLRLHFPPCENCNFVESIPGYYESTQPQRTDL